MEHCGNWIHRGIGREELRPGVPPLPAYIPFVLERGSPFIDPEDLTGIAGPVFYWYGEPDIRFRVSKVTNSVMIEVF